MLKTIKKDKKAVFGLNAVQAFFAIILGIALLAYVIVIIMGTLAGNTILDQESATVVNESGFVNESGYTLDQASVAGFANPTLTILLNGSTNGTIPTTNATVSAAGVVTNLTMTTYGEVFITYTYSFDSADQRNLNSVLGNTSTGVSGFFSAINPVYSILAVLVIILVLVVLVRVVQNPSGAKSVQL